jgi:sarcosine oxidase
MRYDVIVVGCGAMGSAACWRIAERGASVLGIEQFSLPHDLGASHGHTRMTRTAYYEHPDYVPLLLRSHALWAELETAVGERLLNMTGGLYMGAETSDLISGCLRAAREHRLDIDVLDGDELAHRFPQFTPSPGSIGVLERLAGFLYVERCLGAMLHRAAIRGAHVRSREALLGIEEHARHVTVRTTSGAHEARHAVITNGPWAGRLGFESPVVATRQTLGWFWPRQPERFALGSSPVWAFDAGGGALLYGFPMLPDRAGLKVAHHAPGPPVNPDQVSRILTPPDEHALRALMRPHLPLAADEPLLAMTTCLYENSPDGHFTLRRISDQLSFATGFSGHGFKFAPVVGQVMADLALDGRTSLPAAFLDPHTRGIA